MSSKKLLLMGPGRSGKTSIRTIIFGNYLPRDTVRLGTTIELDQTNETFLSNLTVNLWDCGGQKKYVEHFLTRQTDAIFGHVGALIYVFDINQLSVETSDGSEASGEWTRTSTIAYFAECVRHCHTHSPGAQVFCFLNKIDLVNADMRDAIISKRKEEIIEAIPHEQRSNIAFFATTIWNHSLFTAWSAIMHSLVPNVAVLHTHLDSIRHATGAAEVAVFDTNTFLCICNSSDERIEAANARVAVGMGKDGTTDAPTTTRVTNIIKKMRLKKRVSQHDHEESVNKTFCGLRITTPEFRCVIEPFTPHTFILLATHDTSVPVGLHEANLRLGTEAFLRYLLSSPDAEAMKHIMY